MPESINLDAYLQRIGYVGPRTPTLDTLRRLHALHPNAIVFEAIDVLLGRGISLDPAAVDAKLITAGRGGYCFEQNSLLRRALIAMGFQVEGLAGRVRWMAPPDAPATALTHMLLRVRIDAEDWLADVGFGTCVPTEPLRLNTATEQQTLHGAYRLLPKGDLLMLQAQLGESWETAYEFARQPAPEVDYKVGNWFTATHPDSLFRNNLTVSRTTDQARYTLSNSRYSIRYTNGGLDRHTLTADEIATVLAQVFRLPVEPAWRPMIEKYAAIDISAT